jgi:hypothetical protein
LAWRKLLYRAPEFRTLLTHSSMPRNLEIGVGIEPTYRFERIRLKRANLLVNGATNDIFGQGN